MKDNEKKLKATEEEAKKDSRTKELTDKELSSVAAGKGPITPGHPCSTTA